MQKNINVADAYQSATNTRPAADFKGPEFDELVASIKLKGVLVPVLVRETKKGKFEVIAGNRRLAAAKAAGRKEIPANVVEMDDTEAREAQIIENLQRKDIHPLEEGQAYRKLIEAAKYEVADVAAKVGKSETYVRQRLLITNLEAKPAAEYREGKILDGAAVLIARLSPLDQDRTLKALHDAPWRYAKVADLKEWIEENIYSPLERQPWLGDKDAEAAAGKCVECKPNLASLFGPVREGACTDLKCWTRKMNAYVSYRAQKEKLHKISDEYGNGPKGMIGRSSYTVIAAKGRDRCASTHKAIVAHGGDIGNEIEICSDAKCPTHGKSRSEYRQTPEERAKRKKELARQRTNELKKYNELVATVKRKVKWPLTEKTLDVLLDRALNSHGVTSLQRTAARLGVKMGKETHGSGQYAYASNSYKPGIRAHIAKASAAEKAQLMVELILLQEYTEAQKKLIAKL